MFPALTDALVLDLSRLLPGPYCSMILADHGARVICIEDRRFEKEYMAILKNINRNKEHMTLNLKSEKGKQVFLDLAAKADIVLEGFRPGVVEKLGVSYPDLKAINPGIIYCSITGYGQTGPLKDRAGHDVNFLGYSGVLSLIGRHSGAPCIPGIQIADIVGGLNAAIGILLALNVKEKTGKGQYIDISMTDALMGLLPIPAGTLWESGAPPERGNALLSHRYACYNVYRTKDNRYITIGALEPRFWKVVCDYFDLEAYIPLQFDETRKEEIIAEFQKRFLEKTRDEWEDIFRHRDACLGGVLDIDEVFRSDYAREREMIQHTAHTGDSTSPMIGIPVKLSETPGQVQHPPPYFGQHTQSILKELGFSESEIEEMGKTGVF